MTDDERSHEFYCAWRNQEPNYKRADLAFLAGRESMRVERVGNLHTIAKDWQDKFEAERARSAKLIQILEEVSYFSPGILSKEFDDDSTTLNDLFSRIRQTIAGGQNESDTKKT